MLLKLTCVCLIGVVLAQDYQEYQQHRPAPNRIQTSASEPKPTPVPILKQINRHNEDGSYTYGYEGADGSFKIETKLATGEVKGKYGYVDADNKVRVVEYGANKYGFQPSGEGITVAPPTLVDETTDKNGQTIPDYEDEQPQIPQQQQQQKPYIARIPRPQPQPQPQPRPQRPPQQPHFLQFEQQEQQPQYLAPSVARAQIENAAPIDVVYSSRQRAARPDPEYNQQQTFIPAPQVHEHQPSFGPSPIARSFPAAARPAQPIAYSAPRAAPSPPQYHAPQQQQPQFPIPQPQQQQYSASSQQGRSTSVLDQLAKDFALPQGGSPALHDITYSYY
ncbi:Endocuticle structural glycoprotein SgAbd-9 [Pseudolycoriella hygida]|uniref:Endocuticle structural glycoprotein SgAbd-9 n=1 Tax=Pseudolycoriella hygida TaxID=35572 RepID=A0A9Q0RZ44_9DIPT|nr:Endocuticle structural glycoprotein SgAbd-9 [Pseudolycoriella hygida]